ncbi:MAG: hypothetical protein EAY75_07560 [Bacteroidetes bacterium]|nr:MAG: hypothetical protein EAY75_07560 [Bacteroidota bacterium]
MKVYLPCVLVLLCVGNTPSSAQLLNDVTEYKVPQKNVQFTPRLRWVAESKLLPPEIDYRSFLDYPFVNMVNRYGVQYHLGNRKAGVYFKTALASYNTYTSRVGSLPRNTFNATWAKESHALFYLKTPAKKTVQWGMVVQNVLQPFANVLTNEPVAGLKTFSALIGFGANR